MNKNAVKYLYKKEILDVLRDKKTVLMMLIVPLVVYPLLMLVSMQMMSKITTSLSESTYKIAFDFEDNNDYYASIFQDDNEYLKVVKSDNPKEDLAAEAIDAYISVSKDEKDEIFTVHYISSVTNSGYAVNRIEEAVKKYARTVSEGRIKDAGLDVDYILKPATLEYADIASKEQSAGSLLGMLIPFMLVVSLLMGTMYPAIDTTAGEKERGTMETLLTLPVSNKELIVSKFLTVATIGIVSAVLNIISMAGVGIYMYNMVSITTDSASVNMSKFLPVVFVGALCILAFAVFISAITMCVCAFAKSYKEANNYITPLMLVVMFASFIAFIPNVELTTNIALIPVANICLLLKSLLVFKYDITIIAIVLISNIAYGIMAVMFLAKIYNSEAVVFGEFGSGLQIFERRSNLKKGGIPTAADAWLIISVTAVLIIYLGSMLQLKLGMLGVALTQLIIIGMPVLAAFYTKKDFAKTFRIKLCNIRYFLAGIVIIAGAIIIGIVLSTTIGSIFKSSAEAAAESMDILGNHGFLISLFVIAVMPAICEETMFRGYIFSGMSNYKKPATAILLTAALFGVYHMSFVKFFTTAFLGGLICLVVWKSGSILPGMMMHFINNALSCVVTFYPMKVGRIFPILLKEEITTKDLLTLTVVGVIILLLGLIILFAGDKKKSDKLVEQN